MEKAEMNQNTQNSTNNTMQAGSGNHLAGVAKPQPPIPPAPPVTKSPPLPNTPTRAPSSKNPFPAQAPGWRFQPGSPGTLADTRKVVENRVLDASKIYKPKPTPNPQKSRKSLVASNTVARPASIVELANVLPVFEE